MKPEPKKLKELDDKAANYKVKGYTMKATLFEKDIERYEEALKRNGEYEISNATIAQTPTQHASHPSEYQMTINSRARISPLITDFSLLEPQYRSISAIPRAMSEGDDLIDVLGVLLYVDDIKIINQTNVQEIHITDPSYDRSLIVSVWNELARNDSEIIKTWCASNVVIGFTALRSTTIKGFSMASTMSSEIIKHPQGTKAESLRTWAIQNQTLLNDRRSKLLDIHTLSTDNNITSVKEINARKCSTTWQDERFWIDVTMPTATTKNMYVYLGCNKCGRRNNEIENAIYKCSKCSAIDATSVPRITFKADVTDGSSEMELTFFSKEVELLTGSTCAEIWSLKQIVRQPNIFYFFKIYTLFF
ncbi:Replication protein A 70 kDa DNA-binding subunit B [Bienertia sinuspersici]